MFKNLKKGSFEEVEKSYIDYWKDIDVLQKSIDKSDKYFVFYDGPAFANGFPGLHHMVAKNLKDALCKYRTMKGFKVLRKVGWDTHGLPVELQVEKDLGFKSKNDIEKYGIEEFNKKCREIFNQIRGLNPFPGAYLTLSGKTIKVYESTYLETSKYSDKKNGEIVEVEKNKLGIKCSDGVIYLLDLKKEGKKRMKISDYLNGEKEELKGMVVNCE